MRSTQRFELPDTERFWEVYLRGTRLWTRHGKVGSDGTATAAKDLGSPEKAEAELYKRIAATEAKGYARVSDPEVVEARHPALEPALAAGAADDAVLRAYGVWLAERDEPRGELWRKLTEAAAAGVEDVGAAIAPVLKKHGHRLLPSRFAAALLKRHTPGKDPRGFCEARWRHGFLDAVQLGRASERPPHTVRELLVELLEHPSARLLRELVIGALGPLDEYDFSEVVGALVDAAPGALRSLVLADFAPEQCAIAWSKLGVLADLWRAVPQLERLTLHAGDMALGVIDLPRLRELSLALARPPSMTALAEAAWPALERLRLDAGGEALDPQVLARLLGRTPALRHLTLDQTLETGALVVAIAASPVAPRLESLHLRHGSLEDEQLGPLTQGAFESLRALELERQLLGPPGIAAVTAAFPTVTVGEQRPRATGVTVTPAQVERFAPDSRSVAGARPLATGSSWARLGRKDDLLWGQCQGRELYDVYVNAKNHDAACSCPSPKYPCKHAIALLMLAADDFAFPEEPAPPEVIERAGSVRPDWQQQ